MVGVCANQVHLQGSTAVFFYIFSIVSDTFPFRVVRMQHHSQKIIRCEMAASGEVTLAKKCGQMHFYGTQNAVRCCMPAHGLSAYAWLCYASIWVCVSVV